MLELARAQAKRGLRAEAIAILERYANLGQGGDLLALSPDFELLRTAKGWDAVQRRLEANRAAVDRGRDLLALQDPNLLTEDVDFDSQTGRYFFTSVRQHLIQSMDASGRSLTFASSPEHWPMLALKIDSRHRRLCATEVALPGFQGVSDSDAGRSAVICYHIDTGAVIFRIESPQPAALGDMALLRNGDLIVSDGAHGRIYRVDVAHGKIKLIDARHFISPQTPAVDPAGRYVYVPDYVRGIGRIDLNTGRVQWLRSHGRHALTGIDGLYLYRRTLLVVQNGTIPQRVVALELDSSRLGIKNESIIEQSTPSLGTPTHGVVIGRHFDYIVNSGWDFIDDRGVANPGVEATAPRLRRFDFR
ncbi:MAG: hypothetical protein JSR15_11130 [Proteobacteria bacterium]|nr:hypothetical protein [Pseudomonadota bacterium]